MSVLSKLYISAAVASASFMSVSALAKPSINDVQTCQARLEFVGAKLSAIDNYDAGQVKIVQDGLQAYNVFLQSNHVTPTLLDITGGDKAKADAFQTQIEAYKSKVALTLEQRYPQLRIFSDDVVAINGCYSKAPMDAAGTAAMSKALQTLLALAQQN